jgi:hypothetical protein
LSSLPITLASMPPTLERTAPTQGDPWGALKAALLAFEFEPGFVLQRPEPMQQEVDEMKAANLDKLFR